MSWKRVRLNELQPGDVFERWNMLFVFLGDCGGRGRMVYAHLLEPFDMQKYIDAGMSEEEAFAEIVVEIDGKKYAKAWDWPDTDPEEWEYSEPVFFIRKRSKEYLMWVRKYLPND